MKFVTFFLVPCLIVDPTVSAFALPAVPCSVRSRDSFETQALGAPFVSARKILPSEIPIGNLYLREELPLAPVPEKPSVQFRLARVEDAATITALYNAAFPPALRTELEFRNELFTMQEPNLMNGFYLLAVSGGKIVGLCGARPYFAGFLTLFDLVVDVSFREKRIGERLVRESLERARYLPIKKIFAYTSEKSYSIKIFNKLGFTATPDKNLNAIEFSLPASEIPQMKKTGLGGASVSSKGLFYFLNTWLPANNFLGAASVPALFMLIGRYAAYLRLKASVWIYGRAPMPELHRDIKMYFLPQLAKLSLGSWDPNEFDQFRIKRWQVNGRFEEGFVLLKEFDEETGQMIPINPKLIRDRSIYARMKKIAKYEVEHRTKIELGEWYRVAQGEALIQALRDKLIEETTELGEVLFDKEKFFIQAANLVEAMMRLRELTHPNSHSDVPLLRAA